MKTEFRELSEKSEEEVGSLLEQLPRHELARVIRALVRENEKYRSLALVARDFVKKKAPIAGLKRKLKELEKLGL